MRILLNQIAIVVLLALGVSSCGSPEIATPPSASVSTFLSKAHTFSKQDKKVVHMEDFDFLHLSYTELNELYRGLRRTAKSQELFKKLAFEVRDSMLRVALENPEALSYFKLHNQDKIFQSLNANSSGFHLPKQQGKLRVFHASFEAHNAAISGYGAYVSGLLLAQREHKDASGNPDIDGTVLTPCYDFIKKQFLDDVTFIGVFEHEMDGRILKSAVYELNDQGIRQYLVQPDLSFTSNESGRTMRGWDLFDVVSPEQIYSSLMEPVGLAYFPSAVAALSSLPDLNVDVLHLNGRHFALSSALMHFEFNSRRAEAGLPKVGVVATTHDTNEMLSGVDSNLLSRVGIKKMNDNEYNPHLVFNLFSDNSNAVSKAVAAEMMDFTQSDLGLGAFFSRLDESRRFEGISNGIYLKKHDPIEASVLGELSVKEDLSDLEHKKALAKSTLFQAKLIESETKPLFLYVGRLSLEKGIDALEEFAFDVVSRGGQVVIMGTVSGGTPPQIVQLLKKIQDSAEPGLIRVYLDRKKDQDELLPQVGATKGKLLRFAAEFTFVPSRIEAFGLVGLEAFAMGSGVITSNVQGLKDLCLRPFKMGKPRAKLDAMNDFDCFTFDRATDGPTQIGEALSEWEGLDQAQRNAARRRWMKHARKFDWNFPGGALDQYKELYENARASDGPDVKRDKNKLVDEFWK